MIANQQIMGIEDDAREEDGGMDVMLGNSLWVIAPHKYSSLARKGGTLLAHSWAARQGFTRVFEEGRVIGRESSILIDPATHRQL